MNLITPSTSPTTSLMTLKPSPLPSPSGSLDLAQTESLGGEVPSAVLVWWAWVLAEVAVAAVIVVGDVSLLLMFFTRKLLGQSTNILVFSVAIADLMTGLLVLPLDLLQKVVNDESGYMCKSYFYFSNVSKTAVIYSVAMLAMERIVAALSTTFRILSPGRCLFFSSLTWFFAAAYNIWSVVLYDIRRLRSAHAHNDVEAGSGVSEAEGDMEAEAAEAAATTSSSAFSWFSYSRGTSNVYVCYSSSRFEYLTDIFVVLDFLVTFLAPALAAYILFGVFWKNREAVRAPGRPYRSSTSVIVFIFALLVCFTFSHVLVEVVTLVMHKRGLTKAESGDLKLYKASQLLSFTRGFWDVFIFGMFRHYVCRKERALAFFRESRYGQDGSLGPTTAARATEIRGDGGTSSPLTCLTVPTTGPPPSTSLLDSDQELTPHASSVSEQ